MSSDEVLAVDYGTLRGLQRTHPEEHEWFPESPEAHRDKILEARRRHGIPEGVGPDAFVTVRMSRELVEQLADWSAPVQVRVREMAGEWGLEGRVFGQDSKVSAEYDGGHVAVQCPRDDCGDQLEPKLPPDRFDPTLAELTEALAEHMRVRHE